MKKSKYIIILLLCSIINLNIVKADEGPLYSNSIKSCDGNIYGYHNNHYHKAIQNGEEYIATGDPIYTDPCAEYNNTTLKSVTVNTSSVQLKDKMVFQTYDTTATIAVIPTYNYSKVEYEKVKNLTIGHNKINIKLTTPGGMKKTYELDIIRKKILSSNNNIRKIMIDGKQYVFQNNEISGIFITSNRKNLNINVLPEDKKTKITIENNNNLKSGTGKITIIMTAENGNTQNYYINYSKSGILTDIVGATIGILILASPIIILIIILMIKNKKRKKYINKTHYYRH